jgi:hypothetical protein
MLKIPTCSPFGPMTRTRDATISSLRLTRLDWTILHLLNFPKTLRPQLALAPHHAVRHSLANGQPFALQTLGKAELYGPTRGVTSCGARTPTALGRAQQAVRAVCGPLRASDAARRGRD